LTTLSKENANVSQVLKVLAVCFAVLLLVSPAWAQEPTPTTDATAVTAPLINFGGPFGAGLVVIGAAYGIGRLAASALDGMARQPEVAGAIQTAMIISAALIEGFTFFALIICLLD
jgi:F-type H+-transporting ATPase subunit c